jgi:hypothetical protein
MLLATKTLSPAQLSLLAQLQAAQRDTTQLLPDDLASYAIEPVRRKPIAHPAKAPLCDKHGEGDCSGANRRVEASKTEVRINSSCTEAPHAPT